MYISLERKGRERRWRKNTSLYFNLGVPSEISELLLLRRVIIAFEGEHSENYVGSLVSHGNATVEMFYRRSYSRLDFDVYVFFDLVVKSLINDIGKFSLG